MLWDIFRYDTWMRAAKRKYASKQAAIKRMQIGDVKTDLLDYRANIEGSKKALKERLSRAWYIKQNSEAGYRR